jgi:predicted metal-dependent hydrolase
VYADLRVVARAPRSISPDEVVAYVLGRRAWIAKHLARFEAMPPDTSPKYEAGERHLYLGDEYPLCIDRTGGRGVALLSGQLLVHVRPATGPRAVRMALRRWYADRARAVFEEGLARLQRDIPLFANLRYTLRIRRMTSRWGSCTSRGAITMNPLLIQAPPACVDYVLAHELVHRLELNHSPRFYAIMDEVMPDWKLRQERLKKTEIRLT